MKLLQVVWNFPDTIMRPFDMYYFYWPVREAVQRGWEAEVLTFQVDNDQPAEEIIDGILVRRCRAGVRKGRLFSWHYIHALLTSDADIIHCHGYGEARSELAILAAKLRGSKVIFTPHFTIYPYRRPLREFYDKTLGRFFFNLSDRVIVFTEFTYQHLLKLGIDRQRLVIVPHVSRPKIFAGGNDGREAGKLLHEAGITGSPLILGVGRLSVLKGWEHTVRCLSAIVVRFPEVKLLILGPRMPKEPTYAQQLMQLAKGLGVDEHIQILLDNPPASHNTPELIEDAYRSATLLTHPSVVESFGMVLLEALTAGIPVVANNGTGLSCIIDDGVTGYVVDVRDTQAYTEALLKLLSDPALCQHMGAEGRRQAITRFGQAQVSSQLFSVYADVLGTASPASSGSLVQ